MNNPKDAAPEGYLHAWYSQEHSNLNGNSIYKDKNGNEVRVTECSRSETPLSKYGDLEYRGLVVIGWKRGDSAIIKSRYKHHYFEKNFAFINQEKKYE